MLGVTTPTIVSVRYRVDEIAGRAGCSVDTVRFYQKRDLLHPPEREGRVAWYDDTHLGRLRRIRRLAAAGLTLDQIRTLDTGADPVVEVLTRLAGSGEATLDRAGLARATGLAPDVVDLAVDSGLVHPSSDDPEAFSPAVAEMLRAGAALLEAGVDPEALARLAMRHAGQVESVAAEAVRLFRRAGGGDREATAADVERLVPVVVSLVAHHFHGALVRAALGRAATVAPSPGPST